MPAKICTIFPQTPSCQTLHPSFSQEDTANDLAFAQQLASGVDIFVNDSLGPCSQASASVSGVPVFVGRRLAGLQLEKELHYVNSVTHSPARPLVAIVSVIAL
jgi:3-phosphoglycerate kinase